MPDPLAGERRWEPSRTVAAVAGLTLFAIVLGRWIGRTAGVDVAPEYGLVLALALLLGPIVAWGAALGVVLVHLVTGTFGAPTGVEVFVHILLVALGVGLWGAFGRLSSGESPGRPSPRTLLELLALVATAALVVGAASGLGATLLGTAPFTVVVVDRVGDALASMLLVGVPLVFLAPLALDRVPPRLTERLPDVEAPPAERRSAAGLGVLAVGATWCVAGFALATAFQAAGLHRSFVLTRNLGSWSVIVVDLAGPGGSYGQVLLGALALAVVVALLWRTARPLEE